jgi:L-alanine-DL-glutamate epimerase-like enolase superfamily enzyme
MNIIILLHKGPESDATVTVRGIAKAARAKGCQLMVGNMVGTSLSMAPSFVVAQLCDFVDIDGPLLLKYDQPNGFEYKNGVVNGFDSELWG